MSTYPFTRADLEALRQWDTPTICNGLELLAPERRAIGFTVEPMVAADRALPPIVDLSVLETHADPAPDPEQTAIRRHEDAVLRHHIAALPEVQREALHLREFAELSYAEIARIQNVPIGTVMSRLARARASLRGSLIP
jgi:RNA polymerase sigma factor (sigma-70 family)